MALRIATPENEYTESFMRSSVYNMGTENMTERSSAQSHSLTQRRSTQYRGASCHRTRQAATWVPTAYNSSHFKLKQC